MTALSGAVKKGKEGSALKRIKITAMLLSCFIICLSGCGGNSAAVMPKKFEISIGAASEESGTVADNGRFRLDWDDDNKAVILYDSSNNAEWSLNPSVSDETEYDELGMPIKAHPMVSSAVLVKYVDYKSGHEISANSYNGAYNNGQITAEKTEQGIRVTYYFSEAEISVPVEYTVRDSGWAVSVKTAQICEGKNKVTEISLAPFFCSVSNSAENSYLMIPSGSGAIVYPKQLSAEGESYRQEIYGSDPMVEKYDEASNEEPVRLPVFGSKNGDRALCAIVENGAESSFIDAVIGGSTYKYSAVYATVRVRGYNLLRAKLYTGNIKETDYYTDGLNDTEFTVAYSPLYGEKVGYTGMAETYRNYLLENGKLSKHSENNEIFSVTLNGGFMAAKSFFGIPYTSLETLTTVAQAEKITKELREKTGVGFSVYMRGYGETGLDIGKQAGGYGLGGRLGSLKELNRLAQYGKDNGISTYFNFDVLRFSKANFGQIKMFGSAKSANGSSYYPTSYHVALRGRVPADEYALIKRSALESSLERLISKTEKFKTDGFAFNSLGSLAYSDYSSTDSWNKKNMSTDAAKALKAVADSGRTVGTVAANAYAANVDRVFEAPLSSAQFDIFDEDIPFYEIVFKGYTPLSSVPINTASLPSDTLLAAIESGCTPSWSLMYRYDNSAINFDSAIIHNGVWSRCRDEIIQTVKQISAFYKSISGATVLSHTINGGIRITEFSNGVTVAVNRGNSEQESPLGRLKAGEYRIGGLEE